MRRKLAAGNWKMNGSRASLVELGALKAALGRAACEVLICPPATLLAWAVEAVGADAIRLGGQDCHASASGAHNPRIEEDERSAKVQSSRFKV